MTCIEVLGKPKLLNALSKSSHWAVSAELKTWREGAYLMAKALRIKPQSCPTVIHVRHLCKGRLPDDMAAAWAIKGFRDGLVDAKVLPDDSPKYVSGVFLHAPEKSDHDALVFEFEPVETFWREA